MPRSRLIAIGVFVIGGLLLFAVALFEIGDRRLLFAREFTVDAAFTEITGLQPGAPVRVGGMAAGEVVSIGIPASPSGRFVVRMRVREALQGLVRTDSVASIQTDGFVGNRFVRISAGSETAEVLADGGTIPGREPFDFNDVLQRASNAVDEISATVRDLREGVEQVLTTIDETARNANHVFATIAPDIETITGSSARLAEDASRIAAGIREGRGTLGRLVNDDEIYRRVSNIARETEGVVSAAREAVQDVRAVIGEARDSIASSGPMGTMTGELRGTITSARETMANLADTTAALKRSVLVRGFFEDRGYYDLDELTAVDYRSGALAGKYREPIRIWLQADRLFEAAPDSTTVDTGESATDAGQPEVLSAAGRTRLDRAMAEVLRYPRSSPLIVEGFAPGGTRDERFLRASGRAEGVMSYISSRYRLSPSLVSTIAMTDMPEGGPDEEAWDGVAIAVWVDRRVFAENERQR